VWKYEGKKTLGRPRRRWEYLQEVGCVAWIGLIWLRIRKVGGLF
jgi:hypothetical protein